MPIELDLSDLAIELQAICRLLDAVEAEEDLRAFPEPEHESGPDQRREC